MKMMFYKNKVFNQPIGGWNTAGVIDSLLVSVVVHVLTQVSRTFKTISQPKHYTIHLTPESFKCEHHPGTHSILMEHRLRSPFGLEIPAAFAGQTQ